MGPAKCWNCEILILRDLKSKAELADIEVESLGGPGSNLMQGGQPMRLGEVNQPQLAPWFEEAGPLGCQLGNFVQICRWPRGVLPGKRLKGQAPFDSTGDMVARFQIMGNKFLRLGQRVANIEEKLVAEAQNLWNQGGIRSFSVVE